jgi:hypothetical protein
VGDEKAMAESMHFILKHPDVALRMGEEARALMLERFDYRKDVDRIVDVWKIAVTGQEGLRA